MHKSFLTRLIWLVLMVLGIMIGGCTTSSLSKSSTNTNGEPILLPIVNYANFKVYDPVYVAVDQGFFEEQGIYVEIIGDVLGGPTAIQAVASGSADAGLSSLPALINANASGLAVQGVSDIQSAIDDQPLEVFFVHADSSIKSVADLRGKKLAVNLWRSSFHYTLLMALEQEDLTEDDVTFVLLPFDKQGQALAQQQVDVIGLMQPYTSMVEATYGDEVRELFNAIDVFGTKQFTTHFVNREWAEHNPEQAEAFVGGIVDAIEWIQDHPDEARSIIASYTGIDEQYIPDYQFQPNGQVVMDDVAFWLDYMVRRGDVKGVTLTPEQIATNRYNTRVQKSD